MKLSIITPIFNRKHYLENYFSKLSRLTNINDCEILLIDDCSTDGTYEYAEEYKQQFSNLRLFKTNVNSGAGAARNIGIENASGDYIAFLDSDDWFVEDALEKLLQIAYENPNENIVGGSINSVDKTGKILKSRIYGNRQTKFPLVDRHATYQECQFFYFYYTCIYKTTFLRDNNLRFEHYRCFEDPVFYIEALLKNDGQYVVDFPTYNYAQSDNWKKHERKHIDDINKAIDYCTSIIPKSCTYVLEQLHQIKAKKNKFKRDIRIKVRRIVKHIKRNALGANSRTKKIESLKTELNKIPNDLSQFPLDQQQKYTQQIVKLAKQINTLRGHNIDNPTLYQDKVAYIMTYGIYDTLKTRCADKLGVKEYAKEILGYDICVPTLKVFDNIDNIDFSELPNQYVLKSNQGSGQVIVVKDNLHEVLNNKTKQQQIKNTMKNWLELNYGKSAVETHYWNIKPRVFAEQYIENISSDSLGIKDYKFFVFNKKVRYIYVTKDYHVKGVRPCFNYYDSNFTFIKDMTRPYPQSNDPSRIDKKPKFFEQMKDVAEKLAKYFNLVRIDFYLTNDRFYLGEMTFTPSAASFYFTKPEYNTKLGNMIQSFKI